MTTSKVMCLAIILILLASAVSAQTVDEPRFVNRMLDDIRTPSITPGGSGVFSLTVNNPDRDNLTSAMENVTMDISIYHYATLDESIPVSDIDHPPAIVDSPGVTRILVECGNILPGESHPIDFTIQTRKDTPHGSYFSQSSYFVRFMLNFTYENVSYSMASRGHFSDQEWETLKEGGGAGEINRTYLKELGYDGIIPDSAFSVRLPIPIWPFFLLVGLTVLCGAMALSYHVMDNPGKYPKLEPRLLRLSGRLNIWKRTFLGKISKDRK
jgi:hypothetical protein